MNNKANQARCKKCGRKLKDPVSIAAGMGPECRGSGAGGGKRLTVHQKRRQARRYEAMSTAVGAQLILGPSVAFEKTEDGWAYHGKPVGRDYLRRYFPELLPVEEPQEVTE